MGKGEKKNKFWNNGGFKDLLRRTAELQQLEATASQLLLQPENFLDQLKRINEQLIVSSLKVREEAEDLAQEYNKLLAVVNLMDDEAWFCDAKGNVSMINEAAARGLGFKSSADVQQVPMVQKWLPGLEIYNKDGSPRPLEDTPLMRSLQGETIRGAEEIVRHPKTGQMRHRIVNSNPVLDAEGNIVGAIAVVRDIGEFELTMSDTRRN